jgi:hypothetical protein
LLFFIFNPFWAHFRQTLSDLTILLEISFFAGIFKY